MNALGFGDPDSQRWFVVAQICGVPPRRRRRAEPARLGANRGHRRDRERLGQERVGRDGRAQFRPIARPRRSRGGDGLHSRLAQTSGLQFFDCSGRPSHRARRAGLRRAGPDRWRNADEAKGAHSARAAPPAAQCRRRRSGDEGLPVDAASRVLRHRFPSQPSLRQRHIRSAALLLRRGRASLRLSRPFLRVHHPKAAHDRAADRARGRDHRPSRQRRLDVRGP